MRSNSRAHAASGALVIWARASIIRMSSLVSRISISCWYCGLGPLRPTTRPFRWVVTAPAVPGKLRRCTQYTEPFGPRYRTIGLGIIGLSRHDPSANLYALTI